MITHSATIGYWREDGDFRVMATLSNVDDEFSPEQFNTLCLTTMQAIATGLVEYDDDLEVCIYEREDTPHYLNGSDVDESRFTEDGDYEPVHKNN